MPLINFIDSGFGWSLAKPTHYIVGGDDRTIQPDLRRFLAKRKGAITAELKCSHVPMLSQPRQVYEVIIQAARGVLPAE